MLDNVMDDFMVRAVLAGIAVALAAAPLGCFVFWRRMAYFGDATAHAAILGVALSLLMSTSMLASVLAFGLVAVSFLPGVRINLMAYLFGDILAVSKTDLAIIASGGLLVLGLLRWRWSALLTATLNEDLARASGINPRREQLVLTLSLAVVVAVALKVVGALLITALLIIPAATARRFCHTPELMAIAAAIIGGVSTTGGLQAAYWLDTPTGPTIVCLAALLFALSSVSARLSRRGSQAGSGTSTRVK